MQYLQIKTSKLNLRNLNKDNIVVKLNNFEYAGDDLENFFIRIAAHNKFFGNVPYEMIGFAYNSRHEFCAVLVHRFSPRKA